MRQFIAKYIAFGEAKLVAKASGLSENQITYWKKKREHGGRYPNVLSLVYLCRGIVKIKSEKGLKLNYERVILEAITCIENPSYVIPQEYPVE